MEADSVERRQEELGIHILENIRNELYYYFPYLDGAFACISGKGSEQTGTIGTDGAFFLFSPEYLLKLYVKKPEAVRRGYLHMLLHCLYLHLFREDQEDRRLWNLACDIAVESILDDMYVKCIRVAPTPFRRDWYGRLRGKLSVLNAEGVYRVLKEENLEPRRLERLEAEFLVDDHSYWDLPEDSPKTPIVRQTQWSNNREKVQTEMETMGNQQDEESKSMLEQVQVENRERYDYRRFLQRFSVLREEMQVDPDSFDYIFYTYGLSLYGNMPLVEPLESKEVSRIEDFVVVIDTSMSCSGDLVRRFLEETYDVLCQSDSYFKKTNIHIIQCDEQVQQDRLITNREEMEAYMRDFTIIGQGGTDFRPAFEYVNGLIRQGAFHRLKGLLYFTDGEGIYPVKRPVYDTAFVFLKDQYTDISVPAWAMKLIMEPEQLTEGDK